MRRKRKASFKPTRLSSSRACSVVFPTVSIMGWSVIGWMLLMLAVVRFMSFFMSFSNALSSADFPLPDSPVMYTMSCGLILSSTLS